MIVRILLLTILPLLLVGCAGKQPMASIEQNTPITEVLQDINAHQGEQVMWGGTIAAIENKQGETWLEIVSRDLKSSGRPKRSDTTGGRFIAKITTFLEPEIYHNGRAVTVVGRLTGSQAGFIGEHGYVFPVVTSGEVQLWPENQNNQRAICCGGSSFDWRWGMHSRHFHYFTGPRYPYWWY